MHLFTNRFHTWALQPPFSFMGFFPLSICLTPRH